MRSESKEATLWDWVDWLWCREEKGVQPFFREQTLTFLKGPIEFKDGAGRIVYVVVTHIEEVSSKTDEQIAFDFQLSSSPIPPQRDPTVARKQEAKIIVSSGKIDEKSKASTIYGFAFTSLNTLEQNRENLRDFVFRQWKQENEYDPLLDD